MSYLTPRSEFVNYHESKEYASRQVPRAKKRRAFFGFLGITEGAAIVLEATAHDPRPVPLTFTAVALALTGISTAINHRNTREAEVRSTETWGEFHEQRYAELAAQKTTQQPSAEQALPPSTQPDSETIIRPQQDRQTPNS